MKISKKMIRHKVKDTDKYVVNLGSNRLITVNVIKEQVISVHTNQDRPATFTELRTIRDNFFEEDDIIMMSFPDTVNKILLVNTPDYGTL